MLPHSEMAVSVPSFLFHDELYARSGVDSAYVLQEKHDVVVEKSTKLKEQMTPISTLSCLSRY
jgi:hypothetical protein